ncbi:unnamed protein product, partial [Ixodes hexagonus]
QQQRHGRRERSVRVGHQQQRHQRVGVCERRRRWSRWRHVGGGRPHHGQRAHHNGRTHATRAATPVQRRVAQTDAFRSTAARQGQDSSTAPQQVTERRHARFQQRA